MPVNLPIRLGVNIDHVATVRNARGGKHPDPVKAAEIFPALEMLPTNTPVLKRTPYVIGTTN